jgi:hypothetical protein
MSTTSALSTRKKMKCPCPNCLARPEPERPEIAGGPEIADVPDPKRRIWVEDRRWWVAWPCPGLAHVRVYRTFDDELMARQWLDRVRSGGLPGLDEST